MPQLDTLSARTHQPRCLGLMLVCLCLPIQAQMASATDRDMPCHETDGHVIRPHDHFQRPGQTFTIYRKSTSMQGCGNLNADKHAPNHKIAPKQPAFFLEAKGKWLLLDEGTGPDQRQLQVWNMDTGKRVWRQPYGEPASFDSDGQQLHYWMPLATQVTPTNCPNLAQYKAADLRAQLQVKAILELRNLTSNATQERRCVPIQ